MTRVHVAARVPGLVFALTLWAPPERASAACGGVRTAYPGLRLLRARKREFLSSRVVIALGANWTIS